MDRDGDLMGGALVNVACPIIAGEREEMITAGIEGVLGFDNARPVAPGE